MKKFFLFAAAVIAAVTVNAKVVSFAGIVDKSSADAAKSSCEAACDFENLTAAGVANSDKTAYCAELTQTVGTTEWGKTFLTFKSDSQVYFEFKDKNDSKKVAKFWNDYFQPSGKAVCLVITELNIGDKVTLNLKSALNKETLIEGATVGSSNMDSEAIELTAAADEIRVYSTNVAGDADAKWKLISVAIGEGGDDPGEGGEGGESAAGVWDFANWPAADGYTNQVRENLGLYACSPSAETQISNFGQTEASAKNFSDGYEGVNRFKLNGAGFASDPGFTATPTQRFVYFNVTAASTIKIWFRGGGSGDRILYVTDGNEVLGEMKTTNSDPYIMEATSKGAGRIYIFADKAQNLYKIEATNVGTTEEIKDGGQGFDELNAAPKAVKFIHNGQVVVKKGDRFFNLLGAEITL